MSEPTTKTLLPFGIYNIKQQDGDVIVEHKAPGSDEYKEVDRFPCDGTEADKLKEVIPQKYTRWYEEYSRINLLTTWGMLREAARVYLLQRLADGHREDHNASLRRPATAIDTKQLVERL